MFEWRGVVRGFGVVTFREQWVGVARGINTEITEDTERTEVEREFE